MSGPNLLITGESGQLARELARKAPARGLSAKCLGRHRLDFAAADLNDRLAALLGDGQTPDLVINTAAYTQVDQAETDAETAHRINATAPGRLAAACAEHDIPLIHISTDYVFDGTASTPYRETDTPRPLSVYGQSKLAGEEQVKAAHNKHVILRSSWLYSAFGQNFARTMLRLAQSRDRVSVVADQVGCPTSAGDFATAILDVASQIHAGNERWGVYHFCSDTVLSWADFAAEIFARAGEIGLPVAAVDAITTQAFGAPAPRPAYSVLDTSAIRSAYSCEPADFGRGLDCILEEIARETFVK